MPDCDDPNRFACDAVEKAVWPDDDLPVGKIRKFRDDPAGLGEFFESAQDLLRVLSKLDGSAWVSFVQVGYRLKELSPSNDGEPNSHRASKSSASASTWSRS